MLKINFTPQRNDKGQQVISWAAPVLTIDGEEFDLSLIPDGASVQHETILQGARDGENYEVLLLLNHGQFAPHATRFPVSLETQEDGPIDVPLYNEEVNNELA